MYYPATELDEGVWTDITDEDICEMFSDLIASSQLGTEYDYTKLYTREYFEQKFPGLPPEAIDVLYEGQDEITETVNPELELID